MVGVFSTNGKPFRSTKCWALKVRKTNSLIQKGKKHFTKFLFIEKYYSINTPWKVRLFNENIFRKMIDYIAHKNEWLNIYFSSSTFIVKCKLMYAFGLLKMISQQKFVRFWSLKNEFLNPKKKGNNIFLEKGFPQSSFFFVNFSSI